MSNPLRTRKNVGFHAKLCLCLLSIFFSCALPVHAQSLNAKDIREMCSPILAAAVTSQTNIDRTIFSRESSAGFLCSQTHTTEESAKHAGIDVDAVYSGVKVGFLYSDDQKKSSEARNQLCQGNTSTVDSSYAISLAQLTKDPIASQRYSSCVASAVRATKDLICYFDANEFDAKSLTLNIIYRPSGRRVGKFGTSPSLIGATLDNGNSLSDEIKGAQAQPFNPDRELSPFSLSIPITRPGVVGGGVSFSLDDGTSCSERFSPLSAEVKVEVQPIGTSLSRTEGRHSYHADETRDCGSDDRSTSFETKIPDEQVAVPNQNLMSQVQAPNSSNCGNGASQIRDVTALGDGRHRITYNIKGCGFGVFRDCKGRGWIDQYGFIRTKSIDLTKPLPVSHTESKLFPTGRVEVFQGSFKQGVEPDFILKDYLFIANFKVPEASETGGYRTFSLRGYANDVKAAGSKYCEEWRRDGKFTSVGAQIGKDGVFIVFQEDVSCENLNNRIGQVAQTVKGLSSEGQCERMRDGLGRLPNVSSEKLTADQVFQAAACKR